MIKKIGVLTSGGDCAGLNAALQAITKRAEKKYGWQIIGIKQGTMGLMREPIDYCYLNSDMFNNANHRLGGTILGTTNKGNPFNFPQNDGSFKDRSDEIVAACKKLELEGLIGIGGDGSLKILYELFHKAEVPFIGVPKTIDNDLGLTENSIGFATAVEIATEALDRLHPTASSHERVMILEVMGRDAGHIALSAGIAGNADIIILPEIPYTLNNIVKHINHIFENGRNYALMIVAEAVKTEEGESSCIISPITGQPRFSGIAHYFSEKITQATVSDSRFTILGHVQRGAQPIAQDRVLASTFGVHAIDLLAQGKINRMVAWQNRSVVSVPIVEAINGYKPIDEEDTLIKTARGLGISLGDL